MASNSDSEEDSGSEDLMDQWRQKQSQTAEELRDLVKKGENDKLRKMVNPQNCDSRSAENGSTALIAATYVGNTEAVQILLDAGADPNLARSDGINPLIMATSSDNKHSAEKAASMVESLLQRGADPFARDNSGKNALHWAMKRAYTGAAKRIVHAGQYYRVSKKPGTCLIINVNNYDGDSEWIREGSELDEKKIEEVFSELQFKVEFCRDPTGDKIYDVIHTYAKSEPQDDMFVCFIMGHGANAGVYGKDWKLQTFHDIVTPLRPVNCPSLKDKPKIFFVQACRSSHDSTVRSSDFSSGGPRYTPQDADFQFTYATTENNVALRIPEQGSPFIMSVCEAVKANSGSLSLHDILLQVQSDLKQTGRKMCTEDGYEYGMVYEIHHTLSFNVALSHRLLVQNNAN